jgi:hypothetical protein
MEAQDADWGRKGGTLSDATAKKEFGLTEEEIIHAIRAGKLQYRETWIYGNPCLRLLRREVEKLVGARHGVTYLKDRQANAELTRINREMKRLKTRIAALEARKSELTAALGK